MVLYPGDITNRQPSIILCLLSDMNVTLWEVLSKACVSPVLISDRFALEQTMLVAILHHHVGTEVGKLLPRVVM